MESGLRSKRLDEERRILEALGKEIKQVLAGDEGTKWKEGMVMSGRVGKSVSEDVVMAEA